MPLRKVKKRKKKSRMNGKNMGTHGWGARKKHKKSGHRGGSGMSGTGKRSDQKKTLITKLYGHKYFGKQGVTSRKTKRDTRQRINLADIELKLEKLGKKTAKGYEIELKDYKILNKSKDYKVKNKLFIKARAASKSAAEEVKKAGGEILLPKKEVEEKKGVVKEKED